MNINLLLLRAEQLNSIPKKERAFLVILAHAMNEVNSLRKLLLLASNYDEEQRWIAHGSICQSLVLGRALTGKLYETWKVISEGFFTSQLCKKYDPLLDSDGSNARNRLKRYFGKKGAVSRIRHEFAFHYSLDHASNNVPADLPSEELSMYFQETDGNTLYQFAEYVIGKSLQEAIDPSNPNQAFEKIIDETASVASDLNMFSQRIIFAILTKNIGLEQIKKQVECREMGQAPDSKSIHIPFFFNHKPEPQTPIGTNA